MPKISFFKTYSKESLFFAAVSGEVKEQVVEKILNNAGFIDNFNSIYGEVNIAGDDDYLRYILGIELGEFDVPIERCKEIFHRIYQNGSKGREFIDSLNPRRLKQLRSLIDKDYPKEAMVAIF